MANLITGFESPTYTSGPIPGQQGWTGNAETTHYNLANVSTAFPKTGTQALTISDDPLTDYNAGFQYGPQVISPGTGTGTLGTTTSFSFKISGVTPGVTSNNARHDIYIVSNAGTDVDPRFGFNNYVGGISLQPDGRVLAEVYTPDFGGYMALDETGVTWTPNVYHTITIAVNPTTKAMTYTYDGAALASTQAFYETAVGNVAVVSDLGSVATEKLSLDDVSVVSVPEPASLGLTVVGGLVAGRRRRA